MLLFNSRLYLFPVKLRSKWAGPYIVEKVFSYRSVELFDMASKETFKVNGARLKVFREKSSVEDLKWIEAFSLCEA